MYFFPPFLISILFFLISSGYVSFVTSFYVLHIALCFKKYQRSNIGACLNALYCSSKKKIILKKELPVNSPSFTVLSLFSHHRRFSDSTASITSTL